MSANSARGRPPRKPNLHGRLLQRIAVSNVVVYREVVRHTFLDGPGEIDVLVIYQIEHGQIAKT